MCDAVLCVGSNVIGLFMFCVARVSEFCALSDASGCFFWLFGCCACRCIWFVSVRLSFPVRSPRGYVSAVVRVVMVLIVCVVCCVLRKPVLSSGSA